MAQKAVSSKPSPETNKGSSERNKALPARNKTSPARKKGSDGYHHGYLKDALILAGQQILEQEGVRALTMREVARRAGVSHAAPAHHFPSLGVFLAEIAARGFDEFTRTLDDARADCGSRDVGEQLCAMGRNYVRFALSHRAVFRLMFDRDTHTTPTEALEESARRAYQRLVNAVRDLAPRVDETELSYRVDAIWALVHGYSHLLLEGKVCHGDPTPENIDRQVTQALRAYIAGLDRISA
jgi:AcrR family transcriptional regulator